MEVGLLSMLLRDYQTTKLENQGTIAERQARSYQNHLFSSLLSNALNCNCQLEGLSNRYFC